MKDESGPNRPSRLSSFIPSPSSFPPRGASMPSPRLDRRTFLRASGVAIALPFLDAMVPASASEAKKAMTQPPRMVLVGQPLGMYGPHFFPEKVGRDYEPSPYLKLLQPVRDR